jgi:putative heme transporter
MTEAPAAAPSAPAPIEKSAPPTRRSIVLRVAALVAIILVVFGVVLPRLIDVETVREALAGLSAGQVALLGATTLVAYIASAGPAKVLVRGLSWPRAVVSDLIGRAVASTIPGPSDVAIKSVLYRQWAVPVDSATAGLALASLFEPLSSLALPLVATIGIVLTGQQASSRVILLAIAGLVILGAAALALTAVVRSESLARSLGGWLEGAATRLWTWFRRTPPTGIVQAVLDFRVRSKDILSQRGAAGFVAAIAAKLAWFVVFELALSAVGLPPSVLPPAAVLTAMALVGIVALVPITPGAVGVAEVAYIGVLSSVAGPGAGEAITAAVLLFRVAQWFGPIPIGWVLLLLVRGRRLTEELAGGG